MSIETYTRAAARPGRFSVRKYLVASAALLGAMGAASAGHAQTAPAAPPAASAADQSTMVQEVYVTARKKTERLIDVPVAITALSSEAVNRYGIKDLKSLAQNVPNLMIVTVGSGSGSAISIRGMGSIGADVGVPNEVAFNIDGVAVGRGRVVFLGLLDADNVQVLKGPQALFFGKNSPAGVISVTSVDPGRSFTGYAKASYEFEAVAPALEAAASIPIGDSLAVRLAFKVDNQRGMFKNNAQPLVDPFGYAPLVEPGAVHRYGDGSNEQMGRITVAYNPTDRFSAVVKFLAGRYHSNSEIGNAESTCGNGRTQITVDNGFGGPEIVDPNQDCSLNKQTSEGGLNPALAAHFPLSNGGVPYQLSKSDLLTANVNYKFDNLTLTSVTGLYEMNSGFFSDFSYSALPFYMGGAIEKFRQWSEEVRATTTFTGPVNATLGAYFENSRDRYDVADYFTPLGPDANNGNINAIYGQDVTTDKTVSVFGSVDWKLPGNLALTAGARWTHEKKLAILQNLFVISNIAPFGIFQPVGDVIVAPTTGDNVSPEVTLSWHPQPNVNIYGAFKTGYKSGGTSNPGALSVSTAAKLSFLPEKSLGGEIGAKGEWMDGALRGDIVVYDYTFKNLQVNSLDSTVSPPAFQTKNAAEATTKGVEIQGGYRVSNDLNLRGNLSYNKARYSSFPAAQCSSDQTKHIVEAGAIYSDDGATCVQDFAGRPLPRSPDWNAGAGFTYTHDVPGGLLLTLVGDATYTSSYNASDQLIANLVQDGFVRIDAGIKLSDPTKGWEVSLSGRNLTDHLAYGFAFDVSGSGPAMPDNPTFKGGGRFAGGVMPPRTITLAIGYMF